MRLPAAPASAALPALVALCAASTAHAGTNPFREPDESEFFELSEELVTVASRYAQSPDKAPSIVELITADDLRDRGYRTLADVLRDMPGVYVWKGIEGRELAAFRGVVSADNNKFLLLVDGMPWYDGVYTHAFIDSYLPLSHVAQIEIIKGPGSAVYGTNAFTGVINVVTKSAEDLQGGGARIQAGAPGWVDVTAWGGGTVEVGDTELAMTTYARAQTQRGDGFDVSARGFRSIPGDDPTETFNAGFRMQIEGLEVQLDHVAHRHTFFGNASVTDLWTILNVDPDLFGLYYNNSFFRVAYRFELAPDVTLTPTFQTQRHDNPGAYSFGFNVPIDDPDSEETPRTDAFDLQVVETEKDTRWWTASLDFAGRFGPDHVTVAGFGVEQTSVLELVDRRYANFSRDVIVQDFQAPTGASVLNTFAYAQHTWTVLPALQVTAGGRFDKRWAVNEGEDESQGAYQPRVSPRLGVLVLPTDQITVKVLYGGAFRFGTIRELLVRVEDTTDEATFFTSGTPNLRAETIDTVEAEVTADLGQLVRLRGLVSYGLLQSEIDRGTFPVPGQGDDLVNQYWNLTNPLNIVSAEAEAQLDHAFIEARLAYALTLASYGETDDTLAPYAGRIQYEVPQHMLKARVTGRAGEHASVTATGEVYSARPRAAWAPTSGVADGGAFGLLHVSARAAVGKDHRVDLTAGVRNVLDTVWDTGVYRDEVDRVNRDGDGNVTGPRYPRGYEAPGRTLWMGVEVGF